MRLRQPRPETGRPAGVQVGGPAAARPGAGGRRRRRRLVRPWRLVAVGLLALGLPALAFWLFRGQPQPPAAAGTPGAAPVPATPGRLTLLLLGVDERPGDSGRSDTMIVGAVDFEAKTAEMLSLPRDTWARIPGHGWDKLNAAYAYGGIDLVRETMAGLLGVQVPHYVVVNMGGLQKAVDLVGGIDVLIEHDMHYEDPYDTPPLVISFRAGPRRLTGREAVLYARYRADAEADRGRMRRQQEILQALARAALKPANLTRLPALLTELARSVETDLSVTEILRLGAAGARLDPGAIKGDTVAAEDRWVGDAFYVEPDLAGLRQRFYRLLTGRDPEPEFLAAAGRAAAQYTGALAAAMAEAEAEAAAAAAREKAAAAKAEAAQAKPATGAPAKPNTGAPDTPAKPGENSGGSGTGGTGGSGTGGSGTGGTGGTGGTTAPPVTGNSSPAAPGDPAPRPPQPQVPPKN